MPRRSTGLLRRLAPLMVLAVLTLAGFARLVVEPRGLIVDADHSSLDHTRPIDTRTPGNDLTRIYLPRYLGIVSALRQHGRIPSWDPSGFGGRPLVGNPQAGLNYPPARLAWWIGTPEAPGWMTVAHLLAAGVGAYLLGRAIGLERGPALVAGGSYLLAPYIIAHTIEGHYPHVWAACLYPWAFLLALRLKRGQFAALPFLAIVLTLAFLTGHSQEAYYLALALAAWAAVLLFPRIQTGNWRGVFALLGGVGAVAGLILGLGAVEWLPILLAERGADTDSFVSLSAEQAGREASRYTVGPTNLMQLLGARALGGPADYFGDSNWWEALLYFGGLPSALAFLGMVRSPRRGAAVGLTVLVLSACVFAAGRRLGVFDLLYPIVPGMGRFRVPPRSLFLASLGVAMLAGLGVEVIARGRLGSGMARGWAIVSGVSAIALLVAAVIHDRLGLRSLDPVTLHDNEPARWLRGATNLAADPLAWLALVAPPAVLTWITLRPKPRQRRNGAALLGLLAMGELVIQAIILIPVAPASHYLGPDPLADEIASVSPDGPFRVRARDVFLDDLRARKLGLEKTNLDDRFQIRSAADVYETLYPIFDPTPIPEQFDPHWRWFRALARQAVLDRMNVALLISDRPEPDAPWPLAAKGNVGGLPYLIYRNPTVLPRAYVVPGASIAPDDAALVGLLTFVSAREAVLMTFDPLGLDGPRQPFTPAQYRAIDPDTVEIRVRTDAPGLLVVADTWTPGWTAAWNGRPAEVHRANRCQRVVALPTAGDHQVMLRFEPQGLTVGSRISMASIVLTLALVFIACWKSFLRDRKASTARTAQGTSFGRDHQELSCDTDMT